MQVQVFNNKSFGQIRVAGTSEEPLFCGSDLAVILGFRDSYTALRCVDEEDTQIVCTHTKGGVQDTKFVNESGLYQLILKSNKPEAKQFRKWVTSDVLPSIRKHGGYLTPDKIEEALTDPDTLIRLATTLKEERKKRIEAEAQVAADAPKVLFANAVAVTKRSCLIAELAKIITQNGVNMGQNRLFKWMRENGYLCTKGDYYNQPTQRAMNTGLFEIKKTAITHSDGSVTTTTTTKVTGKGQIYFVNKFLAA